MKMGKTTLHAFIRAMLFGMEKERGKASKNNEYVLREPWDNPSHYAGTIRFESGEKSYRLSRSFGPDGQRVQLFCETDGAELEPDQEKIRELLDGFNEAAFCNTVFVTQRSSETAEELADEIRNFVANCQEEGQFNVREALTSLREKRQELERKRKKNQDEKKESIKKTKAKLKELEKELEELRRQTQEQSEQLIQKKERRSQFMQSRQGEEEEKHSNIGLWMTAVLIQIAAGAGAILISEYLYRYAWLIAVIAAVDLLALMFLFFQIQTKKQRSEKKSQDRVRKEEQILKKMELEEEKLSGKQEILQEEIREKIMQTENLREMLEEEKESLHDEKTDQKIEGLQIAENTIRELSAEMYQEFSKGLNERVSEILSKITRGRYRKVFLDEKMNVRIDTQERLLYLYQVSRGTMDQIYFAVRMAVGDFFFQKERLPVILDDVFVMYDERRLKETLRWLYHSNRQVLLFTCHKRERELLRELVQEEEGV